MDTRHDTVTRPGTVAARVQRLEKDLAAAAETIRHLQQAKQAADQIAQQTNAQMLMYATDLHQMYVQERAQMVALEGAVLDLLTGLVHIVETRDPYTGSHTARVAQYAGAMAQVLEWTTEQTANLELGAQLHDVGKIGIPDRILNKPGPLTAAEYQEMQTHVVIGLRILGGVRVLSTIMPYVAYHHEHYDGRGYPFGLAGDAISVEGRLLAVADAFDAITSERPYRGARPAAEGLAELEMHRGTQFDPVMVDALQQAYRTARLPLVAPDAGRDRATLDGPSAAIYRAWLKSAGQPATVPSAPGALHSWVGPVQCPPAQGL